jgi:hypothetical protein
MRVHEFGGLAAALGRGKASLLGRRGCSRARPFFGFSSRLRVHALGGLAAALSCSKASFLNVSLFSPYAMIFGPLSPILWDLDSRLGGCGVRGIDYLFFKFL